MMTSFSIMVVSITITSKNQRIEKKTEITISETTRSPSHLKVTHVCLQSGIVMIRSESEEVLNLGNNTNIPYPKNSLIVIGQKRHKFCRIPYKSPLNHAFSGKINCRTQI